MVSTLAVKLDGGTADVSNAAVADFRASMRGTLFCAADDGYDSARRVWNANIDRHPALIARCAGVSDVQQAILFAHEHDLSLAVRGGGHSAPGYGTNDGGLVVDLSTRN